MSLQKFCGDVSRSAPGRNLLTLMASKEKREERLALLFPLDDEKKRIGIDRSLQARRKKGERAL